MNARRSLYRLSLVLSSFSLGAVLTASCSTVDPITFADGGGCVAGGCFDDMPTTGATTSSSTGGSCTPGSGCVTMRSFQNDVFPILEGSGGCTQSSCHGSTDNGKLLLPTGNAAASHAALVLYSLDSNPGPTGPYVVPCDPQNSKLLCNLVLAGGAQNPYGNCGSSMPIGTSQMTAAELDLIAEWIACGALDN